MADGAAGIADGAGAVAVWNRIVRDHAVRECTAGDVDGRPHTRTAVVAAAGIELTHSVGGS